MIRETFPVGLLACNCTILGDEISREAIVVDPGSDIPEILRRLASHQLTVRQIFITHAHFDHIAAAHDLKQITGAPIVYSQRDIPLATAIAEQPKWVGLTWEDMNGPVPTVLPPDHSPADNETISIRGIEGKTLYTPGHTEGSLCLYLPSQNLLLAGDTLFAGGVGRTDFPGGDQDALFASIRDRLLPLPDETIVVPGHGAETTLAEERASNPFVLHLTRRARS